LAGFIIGQTGSTDFDHYGLVHRQGAFFGGFAR
jgi:hypothetical protein